MNDNEFAVKTENTTTRNLSRLESLEFLRDCFDKGLFATAFHQHQYITIAANFDSDRFNQNKKLNNNWEENSKIPFTI